MKLLWVPDDFEIKPDWLVPKLTSLVHSLDAFFLKPTNDGFRQLMNEMVEASHHLKDYAHVCVQQEGVDNDKDC